MLAKCVVALDKQRDLCGGGRLASENTSVTTLNRSVASSSFFSANLCSEAKAQNRPGGFVLDRTHSSTCPRGNFHLPFNSLFLHQFPLSRNYVIFKPKMFFYSFLISLSFIIVSFSLLHLYYKTYWDFTVPQQSGEIQ